MSSIRAQAAHINRSVRAHFLNEHFFVFQLEFDFSTSRVKPNQVVNEPSSILFANKSVREQLYATLNLC